MLICAQKGVLIGLHIIMIGKGEHIFMDHIYSCLYR